MGGWQACPVICQVKALGPHPPLASPQPKLVTGKLWGEEGE